MGGCLTETTGAWADGDNNGRPDAGEGASFDVKVSNKGTVTLEILNIVDSSEPTNTGCTRSESFLLRQEKQHKCTAHRKVNKVENKNTWCWWFDLVLVRTMEKR